LESLFYLTRVGAQGQLRSGVGGLGSALARPAVLRRRRAVAVATAIVAALAAAAVREKRRRSGANAQSASPQADEAPVAAPA
jgi:hypothetical protein